MVSKLDVTDVWRYREGFRGLVTCSSRRFVYIVEVFAIYKLELNDVWRYRGRVRGVERVFSVDRREVS